VTSIVFPNKSIGSLTTWNCRYIAVLLQRHFVLNEFTVMQIASIFNCIQIIVFTSAGEDVANCIDHSVSILRKCATLAYIFLCSLPLLAKLQRAWENAQGAGRAEEVERARLWVGGGGGGCGERRAPGGAICLRIGLEQPAYA
jgi:hypothetical protein